MLTGERNYVDKLVQYAGFENLDSFAVAIGDPTRLERTIPTAEKPLSVKEKTINSLYRNRLALSIFSGGACFPQFPGVISVPLINPSLLTGYAGYVLREGVGRGIADSIDALYALSLFGVMYLSSGRLPRHLIHELVHYLSTDMHHLGLVPMGYKYLLSRTD